VSDLLHQRIEATVAHLERTLVTTGAFAAAHRKTLHALKRWSFTGIGTSEAVAHVARSWFSRHAHRESEALSISSWMTGEQTQALAHTDALVLVSQGLSPNAKLVLTDRTIDSKITKILVTAVTDSALVALAQEHNWLLCAHSPAMEDQLLVRVIGPLCALASLHALATDFETPAARENSSAPLLQAFASGRAAGRQLALQERGATQASRQLPLVVLTAGMYGGELAALRWILLEATLNPNVILLDALSFAHGPFQALFDRDAVFLLLERTLCAESALFDRVEQVLSHCRGARVWRICAGGDAAYASFFHAAATLEWLLLDPRNQPHTQQQWPGKSLDQPLYGIDELPLRSKP
jgi:fructoselysine-6-P-deglycase FrlB-like protein